MTSGIYIIHNTKDGMVYVGQTLDFHKRWIAHKSQLKSTFHGNRNLQAAWIKDGAGSFEFEILEYCPVEQLDEREQYFINIYTAKGVCYNIKQHGVTDKPSTAIPCLITKTERESLKDRATENGFKSVSAYVRDCIWSKYGDYIREIEAMQEKRRAILAARFGSDNS